MCKTELVSSLKFAIFTFCIPVVDAQRRNDQQHQRNLYVDVAKQVGLHLVGYS